MNDQVIQLFDNESSTFTYVLIDKATSEAVLIDTVDIQISRDLALVKRLGLRVRWLLETHAHADHITGAGRLLQSWDAQAAAPSGCGIAPADRQLKDGDVVEFGQGERILAIHTPGHTAGSMSFLWRDHLFTGDTLLIEGCGRTDFQGGSAEALYDSVTQKLFTLPDATLVWPGHDYRGNTVSTIGWEKQHNPRLAHRTREEFVTLMENLNLPKPKLIDVAVPANQWLGLPHAA